MLFGITKPPFISRFNNHTKIPLMLCPRGLQKSSVEKVQNERITSLQTTMNTDTRTVIRRADKSNIFVQITRTTCEEAEGVWCP